MQKIIIDLKDNLLEQRLMYEAKKRGKEIKEVIIDVLKYNFFKKKESPFNFKQLDINNHFTRFTNDEKNGKMTNPFISIKDTKKFSKELRKRAWK